MKVLVEIFYLLFLLLVIVKGSQQHMDIIDSVARLPKRKWGEGSLESEVQKRFQEEGLPKMTGPTIRRYLRTSAVKQHPKQILSTGSSEGAPEMVGNRKGVFSDAHVKIMREVSEEFSGDPVTRMFRMASGRFANAGLEQVCFETFRKRVKIEEKKNMLEPKEGREEEVSGSSSDEITTDLFKSGSGMLSTAWSCDRVRRFAEAYFPFEL